MKQRAGAQDMTEVLEQALIASRNPKRVGANQNTDQEAGTKAQEENKNHLRKTVNAWP